MAASVQEPARERARRACRRVPRVPSLIAASSRWRSTVPASEPGERGQLAGLQPSCNSCSNARSAGISGGRACVAAARTIAAAQRGGVERDEDLLARSVLGQVAGGAGGERLVDDLRVG